VNNTLYNCGFVASTHAGIMMDFTDSSTVSGNTIYNCSSYGIRLGTATFKCAVGFNTVGNCSPNIYDSGIGNEVYHNTEYII